VQLAKYPHIQLPGEGNTLQQEPKRDWHNQYEALPMEKSSLTSLTCYILCVLSTLHDETQKLGLPKFQRCA